MSEENKNQMIYLVSLDVLRNDVMLGINEVALRANGSRLFTRFLTLKFYKILWMHFRAKLSSRIISGL